MVKECNECGQVKALMDFHRDRASKDGYRTKCKECVLAQQQRYDQTNKNNRRQYDKLNIPRISKYQKEYYEQHQYRLKEYQREYNTKCRESLTDTYVRYKAIDQFCINREAITPPLIDIKRKQIKIHRLIYR